MEARSDQSVELVADPQCLVDRKVRAAIHGKIVNHKIRYILHKQANCF
jgi:hypothetical protein